MKTTIKTDNRIVGACALTQKRYTLNGVMVKLKKDTQPVAFASDGCMASVRPVECVAEGDHKEGTFFIPLSVLKKPTKNPKRFAADLNDDGVSVRDLDRKGMPSSVDRVAPYPDNTQYPKLNDVMPQPGNRTRYARATLNPELLMKAVYAAQGDPAENPSIDILIPFNTDDLKGEQEVCNPYKGPIFLVGNGEDAGASLLMPVSSKGERCPIEYARTLFNLTV